MALLAELHPAGIRIDQSEDPKETGKLVEQLVLRETVTRVNYYGSPNALLPRAQWFQKVASGFLDVMLETPGSEKFKLLLRQILANLIGLSVDTLAQRVDIEKLASLLDQLA